MANCSWPDPFSDLVETYNGNVRRKMDEKEKDLVRSALYNLDVNARRVFGRLAEQNPFFEIGIIQLKDALGELTEEQSED